MMLKSLCLLAYATMAHSAAVYLITSDYANALAGIAEVYDYMEVFDDNDNAYCDSNDSPNMDCNTGGINDGGTCGGTYTGSNAAWNGQSLSATFASHDSGFDVTAGQLSFPDQKVDPTTDTRCEPYTCTSSGFGFTDAYKGFRCII